MRVSVLLRFYAAALLLVVHTTLSFVPTSSLPTWKDLELLTTTTETETTSPKRLFEYKERLFGASDPDVIFWRDSAGWCPFCEMVWLLLETSEIPYAMRTVPLRRYMLPGEEKDPEYIAAVGPDGVVPGMQFLCDESDDDEDEDDSGLGGVVVQGVENIFEEIERRYPDRFPSGNNDNNDVRDCANEIFARLRIARRSYEACAGADRFERDVPGDLAEALEDLDDLLATSEDEAETYLGGATSPSISDIMILPFLERTAAVVPYFFGTEALDKLKFERASRYLQFARDNCWAYSELCSDATTLARTNLKYAEADAVPRYSVPSSVAVDEAAAAEIDGTNPVTYKDWADTSNREERLEAASRLVNNAPNVAAFAMRCCADIDVDEYNTEVVDAALRIVATLLIHDDGNSNVETTEFEARTAARALADKYGARAVSKAGDALDALSLNVGVPRDMGIYTARALRSHIRILVVAIRR